MPFNNGFPVRSIQVLDSRLFHISNKWHSEYTRSASDHTLQSVTCSLLTQIVQRDIKKEKKTFPKKCKI